MPAMWAFRAREGADLTPSPTAPSTRAGSRYCVCVLPRGIATEFIRSQEESPWVFPLGVDTASAATC